MSGVLKFFVLLAMVLIGWSIAGLLMLWVLEKLGAWPPYDDSEDYYSLDDLFEEE